MKKLICLFLMLICELSHSQYSNYYNINSNLKVSANINHNISGNVYEHKTITTIDYGALQLANSQIERNRLEQQKFADEQQKKVALEITENPLKAFDYGSWFTISTSDKKQWKKEDLKGVKNLTGFKEFRIDYVLPNSIIFSMLAPYQLQNVSSDGVTTNVYIYLPTYNIDKHKVDFEDDFDKTIVGGEEELPDEQNKIRKIFFHKKELNRATVYGFKGFRTTLFWEDKFEYCITDKYQIYIDNFGNG